ncbi:MAG: ABC transporter permease subunit, partial [Candidatus Poribacteria bacterium]
IAKRELTSNIFTYRLLTGIIVCFLLIASSAHVLTKDYENRLRAYSGAKKEHGGKFKDVKVYSQLKVDVDRPPEPLSVICLGMDRQLGGTTTVSYDKVPTDAMVHGGGNPLLNVFSAIDIVVIVQIVLSLFAILIAYDAISGERERGTLALTMSNSVSRYHILIGKYIGGMASILLPLSIGWVGGLAMIRSSPMVEFHTAEWGRIALLFLVSALYLSIFFLLSMLVSAKAKRSATALVWLLFLWVVLVLIIPNGAAYLAGQIQPIESKAKIDAERDSIMKEYQQKIRDYGDKHQSWGYIATERNVVSGMYPFASSVLSGSKEAMLWYLDGARFYVPLRIRYAERVGNLYQEYYRSLKRQTVLAENLSRLSPAWTYYNASSILVSADLSSYERFIKSARDYRRELMEYMRGRGAFSSIRWFSREKLGELPSQVEATRFYNENLKNLFKRFSSLTQAEREEFLKIWRVYDKLASVIREKMTPKSWDDVEPLDLSDMPAFTFQREEAFASIQRAMLDLTILILLNALLFWGATAIFVRSEVR